MPYLPMQGICEDEFHRNEHGVQSPLYGRRYSLVLYPNKGALLAFRLKKAGCKVWHSTQRRSVLVKQFTAARGVSSALCLCSSCHSDFVSCCCFPAPSYSGFCSFLLEWEVSNA